MTVRGKLSLCYGAILLLCVVLLGGLGYHEIITERRQRAGLRPAGTRGPVWSEYFEIFVYACIPIIVCGGWWLMRRTLAPLNTLAQEIERVTSTAQRNAIPRTGNGDEVDRLTVAFNSLMARLDDSFQQMRTFTLHASHELKTPLTVMWMQLGTLLQDGASLSTDQRESIECQINEIQRLSRIVDSLTLLTKADIGSVQLERKPVCLSNIVREGLEDAQVLAELAEVRVTLEQCDELTVIGDRDRLRQLLLNLVDNAVKYNEPGGAVTIALRRNAQAELEITNTGQGISPDLQPRLFERFVRGDEARSKAIEGCGLGLSICQWIAHAHGGVIRIWSQPGELTTVRVNFPLAA